ncbi:MAG: PKD domain-containing protein [Thermoplasmatota archaeon]
MRIAAIALLLLVTALAGCASDEGNDDPENEPLSGEETPTMTQTESQTQTSAPAPGSDPTPNQNEAASNLPPSANLSADATQGNPPFEVAFTLGGSDDNANLTWTFDADGDGAAETFGDALPTTFNFTYETLGEFVANLTVSDGEFDVSATLTINVTEAPEPPRPTTTHTCEVLIFGGAGGSGISGPTPAGNVGGCNLLLTTEPTEIIEVTPGEFCNVQADLDGDTFADEAVVAGNVYGPDVNIVAFCEAPAANVENSLTVSPA